MEVIGYDIDGTIMCVRDANEWAVRNGVDLNKPNDWIKPITKGSVVGEIPECSVCGQPLISSENEGGGELETGGSEEILAKMRQIDEILERLLKG
jgi:hypothetical protein